MKNLMKKLTIFILAVLLATPIQIVGASNVKINKTVATVYIGSKTTLKVQGTNKHVMWSTDNKKIATVNTKGVVTGKKEGTAIITARVGAGSSGKTYKCKVTVKNRIIVPTEPIIVYLGEYEEIPIQVRGLKNNQGLILYDQGKENVNFEWDMNSDFTLIAEGKKVGKVTVKIGLSDKNGFPTGTEEAYVTVYVFREKSEWITTKDFKAFNPVEKDPAGYYHVAINYDPEEDEIYTPLMLKLPDNMENKKVYMIEGIRIKMDNGQLYWNIQDLFDIKAII